MTSAVVFGGYGTFGAHVCRGLARRGFRVTVAGRDAAGAAALARQLEGTGHSGRAADVNDAGSRADALRSQAVAVNCTGSFDASFAPAWLDSCAAARCHAVDISESRTWAAAVRARGQILAEQGLTAAYGCSSLPSLSGALVSAACEGRADPPRRARITLFIGNRNPKGAASIRGAVSLLGRRIDTPRGPARGFRGPERVTLPAPFGTRTVHDFDGPDYDLLPARFGVQDVAVKVGFEQRLVNATFAALATLGPLYGARTAGAFAWLARRMPASGHAGGVVMAELEWEDGTRRSAVLAGRDDGQRMAALPAVLAAEALGRGETAPGAVTADALLGHRLLLDGLAAEGFPVVVA